MYHTNLFIELVYQSLIRRCILLLGQTFIFSCGIALISDVRDGLDFSNINIFFLVLPTVDVKFERVYKRMNSRIKNILSVFFYTSHDKLNFLLPK